MKRGVLFALALVAASSTEAADNQCQLVKIAEWQLRPNFYRPVVDGAINGQKIGVLLDTGAAVTLIRRSAATKLGLPLSPLRGNRQLDATRLYGVGGEVRTDGAYVEELRIADAVRKDWMAIVAGEEEIEADVSLLLGYEFFHQLDVEFDLPHKAVRLFDPKGCKNARLAYWTKEPLSVPLEGGKTLQFTVMINGKRLLAELDTGASVTMLSQEGATILGLSPQTPGVSPGGCLGSRKNGIDTWIAQLESFAIGDERIKNPKLRFADLWRNMTYEQTASNLRARMQPSEVLLGADFLHSHRVYVAHSQDKLYFSYEGGQVFPTHASKSCSERSE